MMHAIRMCAPQIVLISIFGILRTKGVDNRTLLDYGPFSPSGSADIYHCPTLPSLSLITNPSLSLSHTPIPASDPPSPYPSDLQLSSPPVAPSYPCQ